MDERVTPSAVESELGVLGCCLLDGSAVDESVAAGLTAECFYDLRNQKLFSHLVAMRDAAVPIDTLTLRQRLKDSGELEEVGGVDYFSAMPDGVPSAANIIYYAQPVIDKAVLRRALAVCADLVGRVYRGESEVEEIMDELARDVLAIRTGSDREEKTAKGLVAVAITHIEDLHARQGAIGGLPTGFADLDKLTDGLHAGEFVVIAAKTKGGKTSLAMNMVEHVAVELGQPVGVFSLEMSSEQLVLRMLCSRARVNLASIREGFMVERDFPKLTSAAARWSKARLHIDDSSEMTIGQARAKARRMVQRHGVKLLVGDYLQLFSAPDALKRGNREQEVAAISRGFKSMAKELGVPVVVLCQLNEDSATRESRGIQNDCDKLLVIEEKDRADDADDASRDFVPVNLNVKLNRNGPTGVIPMTFMKCFTRFELAARVSDDDLPPEGR